MMNKPNILITGSDGYIGKHLIKMIESMGKLDQYNIFTLDNKGNVVFKVDIRQDVNIRLNVRYINFHTIIHLAALVRMNESVTSPDKYYETNIIGTLNVLKYINFNNFIFASTGGAENPTNPYGLSKRAAEDIVRQYAPNNHTIFRFYNVTGTYGFPPTNPDGLLFNLMKSVSTGSFNLYGTDYDTRDGTAMREYVHVNDICRALISAIDKPSNKIENLAYGEPNTVLEIINKFKEVNDVNFDVIPKPRRDGDAESMYLTQPSEYMQRNYSFQQLLKI